MKHRTRLLVPPILFLAACATEAPLAADDPEILDDDVVDAVARLPGAAVEASRGGVPTLVSGDLRRAVDGKVDGGDARVAALFKLLPTELRLLDVTRDADGTAHARYRQLVFGFDVAGGTIYAVNGTARGGAAVSMAAALSAGEARERVAQQPAARGLSVGAPALGLVFDDTRALHLAWIVEAVGQRDGEPAHDRGYLDAHSGAVAAVEPLVHAGRSRTITTPTVLR